MSSNLNNRIEHATGFETRHIKVFFSDLQTVVCAAIHEAEEVVGCVAWLKSRPILNELMLTPCTLIVTSDRVHRSNRAFLNRLPARQGKRAISIVGTARGRYRPLMHNKYIVLIKNGEPYAVLTGSYNYTAHSNANMENILRVDNPGLARAYYREAMQIYGVSRAL